MIKNINNKGFTLAEALIAMLLVAIMAAGVIVALMSTKRAITYPSHKEDMVFAVEKANSLLKNGVSGNDLCDLTAPFALTPNCTGAINTTNCHNISCLLPTACSTSQGDYFVYSVSRYDSEDTNDTKNAINFYIKCEGQTL